MNQLDAFWREIYRSFVRTGGFVFGFVSIMLGGWAIFFPTPFTVDGRWLIALAVGAYMLCAPFADLAARAHGAVKPRPRVDHALKNGDQIFLLVSSAFQFGADTAVVIYQVYQGFEIEIGVGRANRVQEQAMLQVQIVDTRGRDQLWESICNNEPGIKETLIVRSALPYDVYQRLAING